jgi:serine/threonine protein kinase
MHPPLHGARPAGLRPEDRLGARFMNRSTVLSDLLDHWLEAQQQGETLAPEDLCAACPELLAPLREQIRIYAQANAFLGVDTGSRASDTSAPGPKDSGTPAYAFLAPPQQPDELGRLGPYRVLRLLGGGGMGMVFAAEDPQLGRQIALKVLQPALAADTAARQRFLREARAMAVLEHDHVAAIHQVGEDRGVPYLAMPLLKGETLENRLRRAGPPPLAEALRIGAEIAEGLTAAHDRGLVHRDIKPANVWLEERGSAAGDRGSSVEDRGSRMGSSATLTPNPRPPGPNPRPPARVKVLDFGLARPLGSSELSVPGSVLGTPHYMSPEQARGEPLDPRSDLFSLGTILYRMTTGRLPFTGGNLLAVLREVQEHEPAPPRTLRPDLSEGLDRLIRHLLTKDRAGRPASAAEVARALRDLGGVTAGAGAPAAVAAPVAGRRRGRRLAWTAGGGALLLLALAVAYLLWPRPAPAPMSLPPFKGTIDLRVLRPDGGRQRNLGLSDPGVLPLRHGTDFVRLEATMNRPAYLYLVWVDTEGHAGLVYPWDEENNRRLPNERPVQHLFWPSAEVGGLLTDGPAGTSSLLLLAREEKLPEDTDIGKLFGELGPQKSMDRREAAWFENGELLAQGEVIDGVRRHLPCNFPPDRGGVTARQTAVIDDPVLRLQELLRTRLKSQFRYSRGVCFASDKAP